MLWKKDRNFKYKLRANIPNTAFFKQGGLTLWYFSNKESMIKRKKGNNISLSVFREAILKKKG